VTVVVVTIALVAGEACRHAGEKKFPRHFIFLFVQNVFVRARRRQDSHDVPGIVPKTHQALTFLATIEHDDLIMKTLAVISILALLTITGAAYTDQLLTSDQQTAQKAN
jgi:hypothetical protein